MAGELPVSGKPIIGYRGSTHSLLFRFNDDNGDPIDLDQNYATIQFRIFKPGREESPEVEKTTDDGISILNTNETSLKVSKENTKKLFGQTLYFELRYILANDEEDAWYANRYILLNAASGGGEEESTFEFTYDSTTHELTISSSSNDAASAANSEAQAKTYRDEAETLKSDTQDIANQAQTDITNAKNSALSEINLAETDAIDAIEQAESDGITAVENARDQGISAVESARDSAISDINDLVDQAETARDEAQTAASNAATSESNAADSASAAATSESNASDSATTAENEADRAETEADRAESEANTAAAETQQQIIQAHGFYIKDQSDLDIEPTVILGPSEGIGEHPAVNLTRNNKGSAWNRIGNNQLIDPDQWRYNYNPATGIYEGRVIMGQWTNEIKDPRDMTTGNWSGIASVTQNQVGIDGESNTACLVEDTDSNSYQYLRQDKTVPDDSNPVTKVIYVGKDDDESRFPEFQLVLQQGSTEVRRDIQINTSTGQTTVTESQGTGDHGVIDRGTYWKLWITITNNSTGNTRCRFNWYPAFGGSLGGGSSSTTGSIVLDVASLFLNRSTPPPTPVYGTQAGQSYTQDPDMGDVENLADIDYNPDESTFVIGFNSGYSEGTLFDLYSDSNNRIYAHRNSSEEIHLVIVDGGTTQADLNLGTIADNTVGKIAVGWKEDDIAGCLDGGTVQTDSSGTIPTVDTLHIGRDYNDTNYWNAFISEKLNYPRKLENNDIQDESR